MVPSYLMIVLLISQVFLWPRKDDIIGLNWLDWGILFELIELLCFGLKGKT